MWKKHVSGIVLMLLLTSMLSSAFIIQPANAEPGTICVGADGSVDQPGRDGTGDTPYIIDDYDGDRYPLVNPWTRTQPPPSSQPPFTEWSQTYGGSSSDWGFSVVQTDDGGYAIVGGTKSYGGGGLDMWLVKTDSIGNHLWSQTYGGAEDDAAFSVVQTGDGGYAIAGYTASYGAGGYDFWLVKTDSDGNTQWSQTYGGADHDTPRSIVQTADGGYAMAGSTSSFGAGYDDFWLVKTDSIGNHLWSRTYGGAEDDDAYSVVQTVGGGYAVAGCTGSFGAGYGDFWLVKTDSDGNMQWSRTYGEASSNEFATSATQTKDGGYAMAGFTEPLPFPTGRRDVLLVKTDSAGNTLWSETYGGADHEEARSMVQTADGGYAMAAYTTSFGAGYDDFWLVKTDSSGNTQWSKTYGGDLYDCAKCVIQTVDGGYAIAGYTWSFGAGEADFWLVKVGPSLPTYVHGIDVSHHQGDINWTEVYGADYRFAFVKATEGDHRPPVIVDPKFIVNMNEGVDADLLVGAYHLAHPEMNNAVDEAQFFVSIAGPYLSEGYLRPALDLEQEIVNEVIGEKGEDEGKKYLSNWVETWISTVEEETGVVSIIYVSSNTAKNYLNDSIAGYNLWIANYNYDPPDIPSGELGIWDVWDFWQYSDNGSVPSISGDVDLDVFNGDMRRLRDAFVIACMHDPVAELERSKGFVNGLLDDSFDKPKLASQRKNTLFNKIDEVILKVEAGNYADAIDKLLYDIRAKMDGDSTAEDWIVDPETRSSLCVIIDHIISSIEAL